jgi:hypothetical protein
MSTRNTVNGPDPVDGLHLALLQQRLDQLRKRAVGRHFGVQEGLQALLVACGITLLILGWSDARHHPQHIAVGVVMIVQGVFLWIMSMSVARSQVRQVEKQIETEACRADASLVAAAATAARELLLKG